MIKKINDSIPINKKAMIIALKKTSEIVDRMLPLVAGHEISSVIF
jgi:hypothetical protein